MIILTSYTLPQSLAVVDWPRTLQRNRDCDRGLCGWWQAVHLARVQYLPWGYPDWPSHCEMSSHCKSTLESGWTFALCNRIIKFKSICNLFSPYHTANKVDISNYMTVYNSNGLLRLMLNLLLSIWARVLLDSYRTPWVHSTPITANLAQILICCQYRPVSFFSKYDIVKTAWCVAKRPSRF